MRLRFALALACALAVPPAAPANPRDEALRLAPTDFALTVVVQNLRDTTTALGASPFAGWFPTTNLGKRLLAGDGLKALTDGAMPVFNLLETTPTDLLHDVLGDAVVFAYTPGAAGTAERSVILVRPRKPDALAKLVARLNDLQTKGGELKGVSERKHAGGAYFARERPGGGGANFYCFSGPVFALSESEAEIKAVLDRAAPGANDAPPELVRRMQKLGVAEAVAAVLIHPRAFDAELAAKLKAARPEERALLDRLAPVWAAADSAAVYLTLDTGLEVGVAAQFAPDKLPAAARGWLTGPRVPSTIWQAVPDDALVAFAGRAGAHELLDAFAALSAATGKPGFREDFERALGPVVGRDKLPKVLAALGPDFGAWVQPPAKGTAVPVLVAAVRLRAGATDEAKALAQALEYGFQAARIAYNATHTDQLALDEERDGDTVIKLMSGGPLPAGARPCFAVKSGHLLLASSPDAIRAFRAPAAEPKPADAVPLARFGAAATRAYLAEHAGALAQFLAATGAGPERELREQLRQLADVLEPFEKVELLLRGDAGGVRLGLRATAAKPLRK